MIAPRVYADLIGKPFVEGGRGPNAYDCVGLAMVFQERLGAELPAYVSDHTELHRQLAVGGVFEECRRIDRPEPGCIVLLRSFDDGSRHIGVMVDAFRMLHTRRTAGAVIEVLHRSVWEKRVIGFYRAEVSA